jgi:RNA polymerase sigma-54 factor
MSRGLLGRPPQPTPPVRLGLHQSARLEQRLLQSPQMIQAMQILQLSALDLEARIDQELEENPFLEQGEEETEGGDGASQETASQPDEQSGESNLGETTVRERDDLDTYMDQLERLDQDYGDGNRMAAPATEEEGDRKHEAMQNAADNTRSLHETLLEQVALLNLEDQDRQLLEYIVWSLDERGYLPTDRGEFLAELNREFDEPLTEDDLEAALWVLRSTTHPGLGAQDLRECLLLQLARLRGPDPLVEKLVAHHLDDLQHNRLPKIAKATDSTVEDVKLALEELRLLEPVPGAAYGEVRSTVILPDVIVEEIDGEFVVRLDRDRTPRLRLSKTYRDLLEKSKRGDGVREWIKKRFESASWFMDALQQRESTLQRIADAVFQRQRAFLEKGVEALVPLRMQEVADEIQVHISTVSRGVSGKYAQTPAGIYPLKFFFAGGTTKDTGESASQAAIQAKIKVLIDAEDRSAPLSDDLLTAKLLEDEGIKIARRTMTKYRKALGLPSSSQRKEH